MDGRGARSATDVVVRPWSAPHLRRSGRPARRGVPPGVTSCGTCSDRGSTVDWSYGPFGQGGSCRSRCRRACGVDGRWLWSGPPLLAAGPACCSGGPPADVAARGSADVRRWCRPRLRPPDSRHSPPDADERELRRHRKVGAGEPRLDQADCRKREHAHQPHIRPPLVHRPVNGAGGTAPRGSSVGGDRCRQRRSVDHGEKHETVFSSPVRRWRRLHCARSEGRRVQVRRALDRRLPWMGWSAAREDRATRPDPSSPGRDLPLSRRCPFAGRGCSAEHHSADPSAGLPVRHRQSVLALSRHRTSGTRSARSLCASGRCTTWRPTWATRTSARR